MRNPFVSIVMPVYNCEKYVYEAIESILNQTYTSFEFIIINDGSSDNSGKIISNLGDSRIKFIDHAHNKGNYPRRNEGCRMANGEYIFIMDADDIALPERLEIQIDTLENDTHMLACGTAHVSFENEYCFRTTNFEFSKINLIFNNAFLHPSLGIRRNILEKINFYNEKYRYASDYDLVCRIALEGKITNLPDVLMKYRKHENQISSLYTPQQTAYADEIRLNYIEACGFLLDETQKKIFTDIMNINRTAQWEKETIIKFIDIFKSQNDNSGYFNRKMLYQFLETILIANDTKD